MYPSNVFLTGFVSETLRPSDDVAQARERLKREAQKELSENIRLKIEGATQTSDKSVQVNGKEQIVSTYDASVRTSSNVEIVGITTDAYFDSRKNVVYAFAYANKYEVAGYYKANIAMLVQQAGSLLHTAEQLEQSGEKAKARKQCEEIAPLLSKARAAQDLLTAINATDSEGLQQAQLETLHNKSTQMLARLAQGVYVYVESSEEIFGAASSIIINKLKSTLAANGCSFVDEPAQADLKLTLTAKTRKTGNENSTVKFCYADVVVKLYSNSKQKVMFNDELAQKGSATSYEAAGRKAMESAVPKIADKLMPWIKN